MIEKWEVINTSDGLEVELEIYSFREGDAYVYLPKEELLEMLDAIEAREVGIDKV